MSPTVAVEATARRTAQRADDTETNDVAIEKLKLVGALKQGGINIDVTQLITDGSQEDSTTGAPQFTVMILDRGLKALNSGVFGQKVDITMDGIPYRLVEVEMTDVEQLTLTFEHKLVNVLRQFKSALKASRSSVTRAQFFEMMIREAVPVFGPIRFVCPEVNIVQPVAGSKTTGRSLTAKTIGTTKKTTRKKASTSVSQLQIRNWDGSTVTLGPQQLANAQTVLETCAQNGASAKATLAMMCACIVEPDKPFDNPNYGTGGSTGILQWVNKPWGTDIVQSVTNSLNDPGATGQGGMMSLARNHPDWSPGHIAQAEQGSAYGYRYDQAVQGAQAVIAAFGGIGASYSATGIKFGSTSGGTYEFSRGYAGQPEDSWTCMQRLAKEVNWRVFVVGRNSLYFVTDDDLITAPPAYSLTPNAPGMMKLTFQVEIGGRTVRVHRHREPKPSEADLTVRIDRWAAAPGAVIALDGYGPADAPWIIIDTTRPLFDRQATVKLQSPQAPFAEPAASSSSGSTAAGAASTGTGVDGVYAAARAMDARNLPYGFAGHTGNWQTAIAAPSQDCSSSVSIVLYQAGLMGQYAGPIVSGDFLTWGQAGKGQQMTVWVKPGSGEQGHVFIEFYGRPAKRFDTVPGGSGPDGPHLRYTPPVEAIGTIYEARSWPGL